MSAVVDVEGVEMKITETDIINDPLLKPILLIFWGLSMIHIGDGDELGEMSRTVYSLVKTNYPRLFEQLEEAGE